MIRRAENRDIDRVLELLVQVNMVHHLARPDLFHGPATKYTAGELERIFADDDTPVFVWTDGDGRVLGYCFCMIKQAVNDHILTDIRTLYIDDLCVDEACRGRHIGSDLFHYVLGYAADRGCYNVTLNVWEGNPSAKAFYDSMGMHVQKYGMETIL